MKSRSAIVTFKCTHQSCASHRNRASHRRLTYSFVKRFFCTQYACQSGVWTAIGVPDVHSKEDRKLFYTYSNWMYQVGVFFSRSSGTVCKARRRILWIMPVLQVGLLVFFWINASLLLWIDYSLLALCFVVGILGGAVYVGAFSLIAEETSPAVRQFSLASASVADSIGIISSNLMGLIIQYQLYKQHGLHD